jgi:hypothetical protein
MAAKKRKSQASSTAVRQTGLSPEGFREPFNIDEVPWKRLLGSTAFKRLGAYGGGSQVGVGIDVLKPAKRVSAPPARPFRSQASVRTGTARNERRAFYFARGRKTTASIGHPMHRNRSGG